MYVSVLLATFVMSNCSASFSLLLSHSWSVFRFLSNQRLAQAREGPCLHSAVAGSGTGVCQAKKSLKKKKRTSPIVQTSQGPINIQVAIRPTRGSDVAAFIDHEPKRAGTKKENPTKPRHYKNSRRSDWKDDDVSPTSANHARKSRTVSKYRSQRRRASTNRATTCC